MEWGKEVRLWCKEAEIENEVCIEGLVSIYEEVYKTLGAQGHSGFSASYLNSMFYKAFILGKGTGWIDELINKDDSDGLQKVITENFYEIKNVMDRIDSVSNWKWIILNKLIDNKPLTALTGEPDEWNDVTDWGYINEGKHYQNNRCSEVFKYVLDNGLEIAYWINDEIYSDDGGLSWYGGGGLRKQITFPFEIPESEEVYLYNDKYVLTDKETIKRVRELKEEERKEDYEIFDSYVILGNNYKSVTFIPDGGSRELKIECRDDGSKYLVTPLGKSVKLSNNIIEIFGIEEMEWKLKDRRFY